MLLHDGNYGRSRISSRKMLSWLGASWMGDPPLAAGWLDVGVDGSKVEGGMVDHRWLLAGFMSALTSMAARWREA
jgi:hypothetical protein